MTDVNVECLEIGGIIPAIIGMRKSYSSEKKIDSFATGYDTLTKVILGQKDLTLMKSLIKKGPSHSKFLRTIQIWLEIKAPISWWVQFDTYKVGVTRLSESTMHRLVKDYKKDKLQKRFTSNVDGTAIDLIEEAIEQGKDITELRDNLPMGYILVSVVNLNMQNIINIIEQRKEHKNKHWQEFITQSMNRIPYIKKIME